MNVYCMCCKLAVNDALGENLSCRYAPILVMDLSLCKCAWRANLTQVSMHSVKIPYGHELMASAKEH